MLWWWRGNDDVLPYWYLTVVSAGIESRLPIQYNDICRMLNIISYPIPLRYFVSGTLFILHTFFLSERVTRGLYLEWDGSIQLFKDIVKKITNRIQLFTKYTITILLVFSCHILSSPTTSHGVNCNRIAGWDKYFSKTSSLSSAAHVFPTPTKISCAMSKTLVSEKLWLEEGLKGFEKGGLEDGL